MNCDQNLSWAHAHSFYTNERTHTVPTSPNFLQLPADLPVPVDDGACDHLVGMRLPLIALPSTTGRPIRLATFAAERVIVFCYPRTGRPGEDLFPGWDQIPGARGCTPESCGFRDHYEELHSLGAAVFGLSTQDTAYQREMVERLKLPFEVLSDAGLEFTRALNLPAFEIEGLTLIKRLTLVVRGETIEKVFYPVFPPDQHASEVLSWLKKSSTSS